MNKQGIKDFYNNNGVGGVTNDITNAVGLFMDNKRSNGYDAFVGGINQQLNDVYNPVMSTQSIADIYKNYNGIQGPAYGDVRGSSAGQRFANTAMGAINGMASGLSHGNWIEGAIKAGVNLGAGIAGSIVGNKQARNTFSQLQDITKRYNTQANEMINNNLMAYNDNKGLNALKQLANGGFTNGVRRFDTGGTHEQNPYGGIQVGMEPDGTRDMVEEGETEVNLGTNYDGSKNSYVFSNNTMPKDLCRKYHVKEGTTFSEASQELQKESEDRPNDPISRNGLRAKMNDLMADQEEYNYQQQMKELQKMFDGMSDDDKLGLLMAIAQQGQQEQQEQPVYPEEQAVAEQQMMQDQGIPQVPYAMQDQQMQPDMQQMYTPQDMQMMRCGGKIKKASEGDLFNIGYVTNPNQYSTALHELNPTIDLGISKYPAFDKTRMSLPTDNTSIAKTYYSNTPLNDMQPLDISKTKAGNDQYGQYSDVYQHDTDVAFRNNPLRYAPAFISAGNYLKSLMQKPDYSRANAMINAANSIPHASYTPTGTKMSYSPNDVRTYMNDMNAMNSRRLSMLRNTSNRQGAIASVLANNSQYQNALSQLYDNFAKSRMQERNNVIQNNNAVDATNAQGVANAQQANINRAVSRAGILDRAYNMMDQYDASLAATRSNNLGKLSNSLQNIGMEKDNYNRLALEAKAGNFRTLNEYMKALAKMRNNG